MHRGYVSVFFLDEPDCTRCNYAQGQIWCPNSQNCHLFYICERLPGSPLRYRVHVGTCGHLYWSQRQLTCVRKPDVNCVVPDVVTFKPSPMVLVGTYYQWRNAVATPPPPPFLPPQIINICLRLTFYQCSLSIGDAV